MDQDLSLDSFEEEILLRPYDFRQYAYCNRKLFYLRVVSVKQRATWSMNAGDSAHESEAVLFGKRALDQLGMRAYQRLESFELVAPKLRLRGKMDVLFSNGDSFVPLEYKTFGLKPTPSDRIQMAAYAVMIEETMGRHVDFALWVGENRLKAEKVEIDTPLRNRFRVMHAEMLSLIDSQRFPEAPKNLNGCLACEFKNFCGDVD